MDSKLMVRNIKLYYWFRLLGEPILWGPILITYIKAVGHMSLSQIYIMEAVCTIGLMILQVPMGALADLVGRKTTILVGLMFLTVEAIVFASATGPMYIWVGNLFWVVGYSLISGADTSLLYDTLKSLGRESEFRRIEGRAVAYRLSLIAVCSPFAGYLAEISLRLPVWLGSLPIAINVLVCFFLTDAPHGTNQIEANECYWKKIRRGIVYVARCREARWIIGFGVLMTTVGKIWFFTYNPYFELVRLPLRYFGWIFFLLNIVAAVSSHQADWLHRRFGDRGSVMLMVAMLALPLLVMGACVTQMAVLLVLCQNVVRGYLGPFSDQILHEHLESANRATMASVQSAVRGLAEFVCLGLFGLVSSAYSLPTCLLLLGVAVSLLGSFYIISSSKFFGSTN